MSFMQKALPALGVVGVLALTFGAAAIIIHSETPSESTAQKKSSGPDCDAVLANKVPSTAGQYTDCIFRYGFRSR